MIHNIYSALRNISVFKRLLAALLCLSMIPILVVSFFAHNVYSAITADKISEYADGLLQQSAQTMDNELYRLENDLITFVHIQEILDFMEGYKYLDDTERFTQIQNISSLLAERIGLLHYISDIVLMTTDKRQAIPVYGGQDILLDMESEALQDILQKAIDYNGATVYGSLYGSTYAAPSYFEAETVPDYENSGILLAKQIFNPATDFISGYILVRIDERFIAEQYGNLNLGDGGNIYMLDDNDRILSSSDITSIGNTFYDSEIREKQAEAPTNVGVQNVTGADPSRSYLCTHFTAGRTGFMLLAMTPVDYLRSEASEVSQSVFLIAAVCIIASVFVALIINRSISVPLKQLDSQMQEVQGGQLNEAPESQYKDELASVSNSFNHMVVNLKRLIDEIRDTEQQKTQMEVKSLTAQINPHFISNTLNSIKMLAHLQGASNIESMVNSLSNIMTQSMGKGGSMTTLRQESRVLEDYINLQNFKQYGAIQHSIMLDKDVGKCMVPKFILQPLVENSIVHGFGGDFTSAYIVIKAMRVADTVRIIITDNGRGMPQGDAETLLEKARLDDDDNHIGLWNVHQRIQLLYGEKYGLTINSAEGLFFEVEILIPYSEEIKK